LDTDAVLVAEELAETKKAQRALGAELGKSHTSISMPTAFDTPNLALLFERNHDGR